MADEFNKYFVDNITEIAEENSEGEQLEMNIPSVCSNNSMGYTSAT